MAFSSARKKSLALAAPLLVLFFATPAYAQPGVAEGDVATFGFLETIFANILNVALLLAGIILLVMLLVGGFRWLTSGGDPKAVEAAKGTLTHAIAGLILLILAFLILKFIANFTGVQDITKFRIQHSP